MTTLYVAYVLCTDVYCDKKNLPRSDEAYGEIMVNIYYMYIVLESVIVIINFAATLIISLHAKIDRHIECPSLVLWSNNTESCFHGLIIEKMNINCKGKINPRILLLMFDESIYILACSSNSLAYEWIGSRL